MPADEHQPVVGGLPVLPLALRLAAEDHVDTLEDERARAILDVKHTLHAEDVHALFLQQGRHPRVQPAQVALAIRLDSHRADRAVVLVVLVIPQESRLRLQHPVQREASDADDLVQVNLGILCANDLHTSVNLPDLGLHLGQLLFRHEVHLVQQDAVGEGYLLHGLVLDALGLLLPQMLQHMLRVDHGDDAVQDHPGLHVVVREESLRHRGGVREASRLDDDAIEPLAVRHRALQDAAQTLDEIAAHGAADAAVVHLDDLLRAEVLFGHDELVINTYLTELVLDDREALAVRTLQDVVQQRGLAGA
mmetsp:Transcript_58076/g.147471  ORF Transcript_58076/g.147471 Transcript_58076/m.147471 type:complete len:306 (+) Transcript_58076:162-1079(+)